MKVLLVYPRYPDTFWSFRYALKFISKKACYPPLGLLTVAAMLPGDWDKRLVDMNVESLSDEDLLWADYVLVSAMAVQRYSVNDVLARCRSLGVRTICGGPLFTNSHADFPSVDHLILNEAEVTLPLFLSDLEKGVAKHLYVADRWADLNSTPLPLWKLIDTRKYASMNIQYSRGCPFDCEFCGITSLFGRKPRTKGTEQLLAELESLRVRGWKGGVFLVDGYRSIISTIYSPRQYYRRLMLFLREYRPLRKGRFHLKLMHVRAAIASFFILGIIGKERLHFWKLVFWSLVRRPHLLPLAVTLAIYGYHFRKIAEKIASGCGVEDRLV